MKKTYTKKQITEAIAYWNKQLKTVSESESDKTLQSDELHSKLEDAKKKSTKIKTLDDIKDFLEANQSKIDSLSSKMAGRNKKSFDAVVQALEDAASKNLDESSDKHFKVFSAAVALILWLLDCSASTIAIATAPIWVNAAEGIYDRLTK